MNPILNGYPIIAPPGGSSALFPPSSASGAVVAPTEKLRNYDGAGMLVDRIVFTPNGAGGGQSVQGFARSQVQIRWRNQPITNGFVTIAAITYPVNSRFDATRNANNGDAQVLRFAKPVWLAPNDFFDISFKIDPDGARGPGYSGSAQTYSAVLVGRQAPKPAQRYLPYLCAYDAPFSLATIAVSAITDPSVFGNPFDSLMHIDRFIFRAFARIGPNPWDPLQFAPYGGTALITDHRDNAWTAAPAPLAALCGDDLSWKVAASLEAKGYVQFAFDGTFTQCFSVGMVGYRPIVGE